MVRRLVVAVAAALGVVALVPAAAEAIPVCKSGYACLYQWYADPEHTEFNGFLSISCDGTSESSGVQRGYLVFGQARCNY
ncbi:hypothetical protein [Saccharothrix variisporea]|uniref:Peptidase inhibitor family I36 n=1 Tax=Saccharothrix variisporea TaxID=543527 RepID=A0A495XKJ2_9PSEU|nr:hypothetical protein [Saccharothrix variisporea]RKT74990.1 hypothetical protein DFJ66_8366 [Saccharothrix variisporea]